MRTSQRALIGHRRGEASGDRASAERFVADTHTIDVGQPTKQSEANRRIRMDFRSPPYFITIVDININFIKQLTS